MVFINDIISFFQTIKTDVSLEKRDVEVEVKFTKYMKIYGSGISLEQFIRIKNLFRESNNNVFTKDYIVEINKDKKRKITNCFGDIQWEEKRPLRKNIDEEKYMFRISFNEEISIDQIENFVPIIKRSIKRYSFLIEDENLRIDLSEVTVNANKIYELELEILNKEGVNSLLKTIGKILQVLLNSDNLYKIEEYSSIISTFNSILDDRQTRNQINHKLFFNPRNLHFDDLVYGGIVGNKKEIYRVSYKADGIRRFLLFDKRGLFMITPPDEINLLIKSNINEDITNWLKTNNELIVEGEWIPKENRLNKEISNNHWILLYDCLSIPTELDEGTNTIQEKSHVERMKWCKIAASFPKNSLIKITEKDFKSIPTPEDFFKTMNNFEDNKKTLPYKDDGYIYTPVFMNYNSGNDKKNLNLRKLGDFPDIVKWKPPNLMTIDFQIKRENDKIKLYINENGKLVKFIGNIFKPFNENNVDDTPLNAEDNSIVEYAWNTTKEIFYPIRVRSDKFKPNKKEFAQDNWKLIHDPISIDVLKGVGSTLLRKYHNKIKSFLYEKTDPKEKTLLDIGSGNGGDVNKWLKSKYNKIVAVEPDKEHVKELSSRIQKIYKFVPTIIGEENDILLKEKNKIVIINTGGENTSLISKVVESFIGDKVDIISSMLSLTFFWRDENFLDSLVNTFQTNLKVGGSLIIFTMDGDLVKDMINPFYGIRNNNSKFDFKNIGSVEINNSIIKSPYEVKINIYDSIVSNQVEYLVFLDDIRLKMENLKLRSINKADKEKFLNSEEIKFTNLYTYTHLIKEDDFRYLKTPESDDIKKTFEEKIKTLENVKFEDNLSKNELLLKFLQFSNKGSRTKLTGYQFKNFPEKEQEFLLNLIKKTSEQSSRREQNIQSLQKMDSLIRLDPGEVIFETENFNDDLIDSNNYLNMRIPVFSPNYSNDDINILLPETLDISEQKIVKIACINSFLHALLKAIDDDYSETESSEKRIKYEKETRDELISSLTNEIFEKKLEKNLKNNFNSKEEFQDYLLNELSFNVPVINYVSKFFNVNIFYIKIIDGFFNYIDIAYEKNKTSVIITTDNELIGVKHVPGKIQVIFRDTDSIIKSFLSS